MKICVGSKNPTKIQAAKNILAGHDLFPDSEVVSVDIAVEEFGHPKTLEATIQGAQDRARAAKVDCQLSVGLESGLMTAPHTKSGYLEVTICALYDGTTFHIGMGPGREWPSGVTRMILDGLDGSQACKQAGLTAHDKVGAEKGIIHTLTKGALNRTDVNELAILMALIHLQNPQQYTTKKNAGNA